MQIKGFPRGIPSSGDFLLFQTADGVTKSCLISELPNSPSDSGRGTGGTTANYPSGMKLWIEGGSLIDKSGNSNNASSVIGTNPTAMVGLDGKNVLRWDGSGSQELQILPFLTDATEATVYVVFTNSANNNYNLIRTKNIDDYWRFSNDGNGYIGTFLSGRVNAYPSEMPSEGSHLISIHAKDNSYEVLINNLGKGVQDLNFDPGDRFRIATNDKNFNGDIALILVYPSWIDKSSAQHQSIIAVIKSNYASLAI
jgi:hypothetical protein